MASLISKIAKNTAIIVAGNILFRLISLVVTIYLARYLGVVDFGKFSFLFAYLSFFVVITDFGLQTVLIREISQNKSRTREFIGNALIFNLILSIISFILAISVISLMQYPEDTTLFIYIIAFSIFFISYSGIYTSIFRANLEMKYNLYSKIAYRLFSAILIFAVIFNEGSLLTIVTIMLAAEVLKTALDYHFSKKFVRPSYNIDFKLWKYLLKESLPIAITGIFAAIYHNIDILMLSIMKGDESVGYYTSALKLVLPLGFIPSAMMMSLFPILSSYATQPKEKLSKIYSLSLKYTLLFALPIGIGVTFLAEEIIVTIFGDEFALASSALMILIWAQICIFVNTVNADTLVSLHEQKTVTKIVVISAFLNVLLNLIVIPIYDFDGAAIATVITEGIIIIYLMIIVLRKLEVDLLDKNFTKIFITNLIFLAYLLICIPVLYLPLLIMGAVILYPTTYYLLGGVNEDDKKIIKKLITR
ncbi:O-antigen/teichoic acid export membrane protein [Methanohalophilus levihalophilus]|uniref:flippase n=1 Tax=Methanohalophilus levihalophilus TaxID=1431282 RepID=UPI001AE7E185|nr:flippase [Methanohalophilus levihalophilus]MBP2029472.1 O-antigen/teichoic acid export membrane protein [Methanohalophilus levihalophilus]